MFYFILRALSIQTDQGLTSLLNQGDKCQRIRKRRSPQIWKWKRIFCLKYIILLTIKDLLRFACFLDGFHWACNVLNKVYFSFGKSWNRNSLLSWNTRLTKIQPNYTQIENYCFFSWAFYLMGRYSWSILSPIWKFFDVISHPICSCTFQETIFNFVHSRAQNLYKQFQSSFFQWQGQQQHRVHSKSIMSTNVA